MQSITRREFLRYSGLSAAVAGSLALGLEAAAQEPPGLRISGAREVPGVCPFCSVGCGIVTHVRDGRVVNVEGNVDHPINEGSLCPKGSSTFQFAYNENRVTQALYRAPGATDWQPVDLGWALDQIADRIKKTRDRYFVEQEDGVTVNRLDAIAHLGSAVLDNEENYLLVKMMRALGVSYLEHQARI